MTMFSESLDKAWDKAMVKPTPDDAAIHDCVIIDHGYATGTPEEWEALAKMVPSEADLDCISREPTAAEMTEDGDVWQATPDDAATRAEHAQWVIVASGGTICAASNHGTEDGAWRMFLAEPSNSPQSVAFHQSVGFRAVRMTIEEHARDRDVEVERLKSALRKSNDNFEECERSLYLEINVIEAERDEARANLAALEARADKLCEEGDCIASHKLDDKRADYEALEQRYATLSAAVEEFGTELSIVRGGPPDSRWTLVGRGHFVRATAEQLLLAEYEAHLAADAAGGGDANRNAHQR